MNQLRSAGAKHVLRLPVRDDRNAKVYELIYATKSAVGCATMKEAIATGLSASELPEAVRAAIRRDLSYDVPTLVQEVVKQFSGQEVRWTERSGKAEPSGNVRGFLLGETPLFRWQFGDVKDRLEGFRIGGRKLRYRFP